MKTRNLLKTLCVALLVGVITASSLVGCFKPEETEEKAIKVENVTSNGMSISFFSETVVETGEEVYIETGASVYVLPVDAYNKSLSWSFKWENAEVVDNIAEYVRFNRTEEMNEYQNCYFRFYKPFAGKNIIATVKTNDGGHEASMTIIYKGLPTSFSLENINGYTESESAYPGLSFDFVKGQTYTFKIKANQVFNSMAYEPEFVPELIKYGGLEFKKYSDREVSLGVDATFAELSPGVFGIKEQEGQDFGGDFELFRVGVVDGELEIEILNYLEEFMSTGRYINGVTAIAEFKDGNLPVMYLTVRDSVSRCAVFLRFKIFKSVESVSITSNKTIYV